MALPRQGSVWLEVAPAGHPLRSDPVRVSLFLLRLTARFAALHVSAEWLRAHDLAAARQPQSESTQ